MPEIAKRTRISIEACALVFSQRGYLRVTRSLGPGTFRVVERGLGFVLEWREPDADPYAEVLAGLRFCDGSSSPPAPDAAQAIRSHFPHSSAALEALGEMLDDYRARHSQDAGTPRTTGQPA